MSRHTGKAITDYEHLKQSIQDILTTPIGSRAMLRDYGSELFRLIDAGVDRLFIMIVYSAIAEPLRVWETRFALTSVRADLQYASVKGQVIVDLQGIYLPNNKPMTLENITLAIRQ